MKISELDEKGVSIFFDWNILYRRKSYQNSHTQRVELKKECLPEALEQIMEVWGDTPTVEDYIPENLPPSFPQPTTEERIIAAQQTITSLDLALIAAEQSITDNDLRLLALEAAA